MKPQDVIFFLLLVVLLIVKRNPKLFVTIGLISILLSMPLFAKHVFFTAERLTYYSAAFLLAGIVLFVVDRFKNKVD